jgi:hypothetical protein
VVTSRKRRERYLEKKATDQGALKPTPPGPPAEKARPLKAVPAAKPSPAPPVPVEDEEINFMLPPGGLMGGSTVPKPKTVKVDAPLNAHLLTFQARYQGQRYKFQNGTIALWRVLLREEAEMAAEARREQRRTGVPEMPRKGPLMRRFEEELDQMMFEASGDIFDD